MSITDAILCWPMTRRVRGSDCDVFADPSFAAALSMPPQNLQLNTIGRPSEINLVTCLQQPSAPAIRLNRNMFRRLDFETVRKVGC